MVVRSGPGDLHPIVCDVLPFLLKDRHNVGGSAPRDGDQKHLDGILGGVPISFNINEMGVAARRRADKEIIARVNDRGFVFL